MKALIVVTPPYIGYPSQNCTDCGYLLMCALRNAVYLTLQRSD
jgi:hypothetical protein